MSKPTGETLMGNAQTKLRDRFSAQSPDCLGVGANGASLFLYFHRLSASDNRLREAFPNFRLTCRQRG